MTSSYQSSHTEKPKISTDIGAWRSPLNNYDFKAIGSWKINCEVQTGMERWKGTNEIDRITQVEKLPFIEQLVS